MRPALDHERFDAVTRELSGGDETGWAGADDQDGDLKGGIHGWLLNC
jgi:hypothetical protein